MRQPENSLAPSIHRRHTVYSAVLMPRQALISREDILDATLALADERGLSAVSMRAVAARLGVTAMSLYRYVRDKDDLLDGLVERLLAELPLPDPKLAGEERVRALASSMRDTAARHPDAFSLLLRRPVATEAARGAQCRLQRFEGRGGAGGARAQGRAAAEHVRDRVCGLGGRRTVRGTSPASSRCRFRMGVAADRRGDRALVIA